MINQKVIKINKNNKNSGITLIALVVTIIVLLILAGISISMLSGNNGILQKATDAKEKTEKAQIIENAQTDIIGQQTHNKSDKITKEQLVAILNKYFETRQADEIPDEISIEHDLELTTIDEKYKINLSEIFKGKFAISNVVPDDIFVALYNDGTLVFSNNQDDIDSTKVTQNFDNIKNTVYDDWAPWSSWSGNSVEKVNIINKIRPTCTAFWFGSLFSLTEIENIENIDTSNVTNMEAMFCYTGENCVLDLSGFDTRRVTNMTDMFAAHDDFNAGPKTIYVGEKWSTDLVTENNNSMFYGCILLVGGNGYTNGRSKAGNPLYTGLEYARIDLHNANGLLTPCFYQWKGKKITEIASYDENSNTWIFDDDSIRFLELDGTNGIVFDYNGWVYGYVEFDDDMTISFVEAFTD